MKKNVIFAAGLIMLALLSSAAGCSGQKEEKGRDSQSAVEQEGSRNGKDAQNKGEELEKESDKEGQEKMPSDADAMAAPSVTGALHVEGARLTGSSGEPVQLRGISTHGVAWFPDYINDACFAQLHDEWKANVIRLAMYTAEYGGYCTGGDKEYLKGLIRDGVKYAENHDMYVIIDWHILSDSDPNIYLEEAKDFFGEMSAEYADADNILYEICNEPNGSTGWNEIKAYAREVIPVICANDEDAVIIVGTPNWSQFVDQAAADPITEYDNIMYTLHFYAATHKDWIRDKLKKANQSGLPILVTEFSICDASGNGALDRKEAGKWMKLLKKYKIGRIAWNISNKNETSALIKSSCQKTGNIKKGDLSKSGKWIMKNW